MTLRRLRVLLLSAVLGAGPLAANAAPQAPIKIGLGAPITGSDANFGTELRNGVEMAVHDINAAGGLLGHRLSIEIGDDAGDPKQGEAVANKFVADHIAFVVGHFNSGVTLMASSIYADNGILEITPSSANPQITERGLDLLFRTCGRDNQQPAVAAAYLAGLGKTTIAILHDRTTYGKGLADLTRKDLAARGVSDVLYFSVNKDETDYSALIEKLKASGAGIFYWGGSAAQALAILKALRDQSLTIPMLASDAVAIEDVATQGGGAVLSSLVTFPRDARDRPEAAKVVQHIKAKGIDPEGYTLYAYAAVQVIDQAGEAAHSLDPNAMAKQMHSGMIFHTVLGALSFDAKGDITQSDYSISVWKKSADGTIDFYPLSR
ncbi:MAG: branched-chain amino acid ABC transporter substrate-binding protein [Methylovirgula sp.]|jgi:branched-chain amino acid transport system substrate-binding protein